MKNLGDFAAKQIVRGSFNSRSTSGAPITLAGTPSLVCYKNNNTTEQTGVTLNVDFDGRTGYHVFEIDTDNAFYQKNCDYSVVIAAGTVDSVSVVGVEVGLFSIENRSEEIIRRNAFIATELAIATVTSQTVFVLTGGPTNNISSVMAIFYDTSASGAPVVAEGSYVGSTGTLTLTAATPITVTTSDTVTLVAVASESVDSVTLADGAITAAKFGAGAITSTVLADNAITSAKIAADAITDAKVASDVTIASVTGAVGSVTGNVGGNVTGSVGSLATQAKADVNAEIDAALVDIHLDHLLAATYDTANKPGGADSLFNSLIESDVLPMRFGTEALSQAPSASAASIRAEIDANSTQLAAIRIDTEDIQSRIPAALVSGRIDASVGAMAANVLTASALAADAVGEIADGVWDEATSGHATSGTYGASVLIVGVSYTHTSSGSGGAATATITRA